MRACSTYIGDDLNKSDDSLRFGGFSDRWINDFVARPGDGELRSAMAADLSTVLDEHLAGRTDERRWGWKEPRSIYLLAFLREQLPSLRFLHFVRDGRDMALSQNQQQLAKHGRAVLRGELRWRPERERSMALWTRVNLAAADFGERELGDAYARVRFEDLCSDPAGAIASILAFFELDGDAQALAAEVRPPESLGRWQEKPRRVRARLESIGAEALERFGYR